MGLGQLIREIRIEKGISQKEACLNIITQSNYSKFELEKIEISAAALILIINNLDISLEEFFQLYEKKFSNKTSEFINQFFRLSMNSPDILIQLRKEMIHYLDNSKCDNVTLQNIVQLSYGLEAISLQQDYETAKNYAIPVWEKLQKRNRWYLREITLLNTILYVFPFPTAEEITKRSIKFLNEYENKNSILSLQLNLLINIGLLSIKNNQYNKAITYLNQLLDISNDHKYMFDLHRNISKLRIAYCKANLAEPFEEDLMNIIMYFISTNSNHILQQLIKEVSLYCKEQNVLLIIEQYEQKVKSIL